MKIKIGIISLFIVSRLFGNNDDCKDLASKLATYVYTFNGSPKSEGRHESVPIPENCDMVVSQLQDIWETAKLFESRGCILKDKGLFPEGLWKDFVEDFDKEGLEFTLWDFYTNYSSINNLFCILPIVPFDALGEYGEIINLDYV